MYEFDDYDYGLGGDGTWETVSKTKKTKEKTKIDPRAVTVRKPGTSKSTKPAGVAGARRPNKPNTNMAGRKPAPVTDWRAAAKKKADTSEMQKKVLLKNVQIGRPTKNTPPPLISEQTTNESSRTVDERENLSQRHERSKVAGKTNFNSFQEYNDSFPDLPRTESNEEIGATDQDYTNVHPFYDLNGCDVTQDVLRLLNATFLNDQANLPMLHRPALGELEQLCQPRQEYAVQDGRMDNVGYTADESYVNYTGEMDTMAMNYNVFQSEVNLGAEVHTNPQEDLFNIPVDKSKPNAVDVQGAGEAHQEVKVNNISQDINLQIQTDLQEKAIAEKHVFGDRKENTRKGCVKLPAPDTSNGSATSAKIPTKRKKKVKSQTKEPDKESMPLNNVKDIQEDCKKESSPSTHGAKLGVNDCKKSADKDFVTQESPSLDSLASATANLNVSRSDSNTILRSDNQNNNCQEAATDDDEMCLELTGLESQCNPDYFQTVTHDVFINTKLKTSPKQAEGSKIIHGHGEEARTAATPLLQENTALDEGKAIIDMTDHDGGGIVQQKTNNDANFKEEACPAAATQLQEGNTDNENVAESKDVQAEPVDDLTASPNEGIATIELTDPEGEGYFHRNPKNDAECNKGMVHEDAERMCHPYTGIAKNAGLKERQGECADNQDDAREPIEDKNVTEEGGNVQQNQENDAEGNKDNAAEDAVRMRPPDKGLPETADSENKQASCPENQEKAQEPTVDKKVTYGEVIEYVLEQLKELYAGKDVNKLSPVIKIEHDPLPDELTRHISLLRQLSYNYTPSFHPYNWETARYKSSDSDMSDSFDDTKVDTVDDEEERAGNVTIDVEYMRRFHENLQVFGQLNHLHQVVSDPRLAAISEDWKLRGTATQLIDDCSYFFPDLLRGSTPTFESLQMNSACGITDMDRPYDVTSSFKNRGPKNMSGLSFDTGRMRDKEQTDETPGPKGPTFQGEGAQGFPRKSEMKDKPEAPLTSLIASPHQASDKGLQFFQHSFLSSPENVSDGAINSRQDRSELVSAVKTHYAQSSNLVDIRCFLSSQLSDIRASLDRDILGLTRATSSRKEQGKRAWQGGDMVGTCRHEEKGNDVTYDPTEVITGVSIDDEDLLGKGWMDRTLVENLENPTDEESTEKRNRREYRTKKFGVLPYWWIP